MDNYPTFSDLLNADKRIGLNDQFILHLLRKQELLEKTLRSEEEQKLQAFLLSSHGINDAAARRLSSEMRVKVLKVRGRKQESMYDDRRVLLST